MCTRFTLRNAASCALHRRASRVVHVSALYFAYDGGTRLLCQRPRGRRTRLGLRLVKGCCGSGPYRAPTACNVNGISAATAARRLELRPAHAPTPNAFPPYRAPTACNVNGISAATAARRLELRREERSGRHAPGARGWLLCLGCVGACEHFEGRLGMS